MAGQQHPFPSGFPNTQQSTMRTQFGGGQMVSGLMGPQQGGMVNPQQFGPGVGTGVGSNAMGMLSAQQVLAQQQQQSNALQQMQHLQQQQQQQQQQQMQMQQQQQQQQVALVQQNSQGGNTASTPQTPVPPSQPPQAQKQPGKDINTASLCRFGQETVQEIVSRTQELFQTLKVLQPPNGTAQGSTIANEKKAKVTEHLRTLNILFNRLRLIYEKCNESCQSGMEYTHIESLIPLKEEWDMKSDEKKSSEAYRLVYEESKEMMEQVILKNRHLKEIIDHLRRIISEINTMLTMRRS